MWTAEAVATMRSVLLLLLAATAPRVLSKSLYSRSLPDAWAIPKCNATRLAAIRARHSPGYRGWRYSDGWMPTKACDRTDLRRDDPCSLLAPPPQQIPSTYLQGAKLYGERRVALKEETPANATVAEIGILAGSLTRWMVSTIRPVAIYALDLMHVMGVCRSRTRARAMQEGNHTTVHCLGGDSSTNLATLPDEGFDVIYIDADHDYAGVCRDLEAAKHKVRVGGLLVFNDYIRMEYIQLMERGRFGTYGVIYVVNEFLVRHEGNYTVAYFAFGPQDAGGDIALRRIR